MSVGHQSYAWINEPGLPVYYRITLVRGLEPDEVLRRFGADPRTARSMTLEERSLHPQSWQLVCVHDLGGWTVAIEDDWHDGPGANAAAALSAGTELVTVYTNVLAHHRFTHIVDGDVRTDFDALDAGTRFGSRPDRLTDAMRRIGLDPRPEFDDPDDEPEYVVHAAAMLLALAEEVTGVALTAEMLSGPALTAAVPEPATNGWSTPGSREIRAH
ncbi:DUF6461 domain-containing protein [Embleya scabrispora]|uniref:DUF6461 domain-containing protein n=1 Tax=Embleya scabrispora TaxID=159449 RepID=UPI000382B198|nr:DUF6461 domain-containing protein [Embleya scabrispora]MYS84079.1 hypothetical protein [Streptomyces sp. SID5474]